eukprot:m.213256 g.213256  ORF g.213256 m.213256 type:complete len:53 (+) comp18602_c0_seq5:1094-1252(+)
MHASYFEPEVSHAFLVGFDQILASLLAVFNDALVSGLAGLWTGAAWLETLWW